MSTCKCITRVGRARAANARPRRYYGEGGLPRRVDFAERGRGDLEIRKAMVLAVGRVRDVSGRTPRSALGFVVELLELNDSHSTVFDDGPWVATLVRAVSSAIADAPADAAPPPAAVPALGAGGAVVGAWRDEDVAAMDDESLFAGVDAAVARKRPRLPAFIHAPHTSAAPDPYAAARLTGAPAPGPRTRTRDGGGAGGGAASAPRSVEEAVGAGVERLRTLLALGRPAPRGAGRPSAPHSRGCVVEAACLLGLAGVVASGRMPPAAAAEFDAAVRGYAEPEVPVLARVAAVEAAIRGHLSRVPGRHASSDAAAEWLSWLRWVVSFGGQREAHPRMGHAAVLALFNAHVGRSPPPHDVSHDDAFVGSLSRVPGCPGGGLGALRDPAAWPEAALPGVCARAHAGVAQQCRRVTVRVAAVAEAIDALWEDLNVGSAFDWPRRRALFHVYHSIFGSCTPEALGCVRCAWGGGGRAWAHGECAALC